MMRTAIIASLCIAYSLAFVLPASMSGIPEEYKEFVPEVVQNFYKDLTPEDKQILRSIGENHAQYPNIDAALNALKEKSEKLHAKAVEVRNYVKSKIDSLGPDAKAFVEEVEAKARTLRPEPGHKPDLEKVKTAVREVIEKYKTLPEAIKQELQTTFPHITKLIKNEKFKKMAKGFLEKNQ
uniref:Fatty-acid and retinol-binding protein 1 n=1 Tax=Parascaris univalens TaxID=6257 RepID=A0A915BYC4_PARUN